MAKNDTVYQSAHILESKDTPTRQVATGFVPGQRILPLEAAEAVKNAGNTPLVPSVPSEMSEENTCGIGAKDAAIGVLSGGSFFAATLCCPVVGVGSQVVGASLSALCCTLFGRRAGSACLEGCDGKAPMSNALR